jgi:hypothetical protein
VWTEHKGSHSSRHACSEHPTFLLVGWGSCMWLVLLGCRLVVDHIAGHHNGITMVVLYLVNA